MTRLRLRTQLLISTVLIICGLTGAILLIVRHTVRTEIDDQARAGIGASVHAFESVQNQRQFQLSRIAAMLAELPTLKALMTTQHAPTIQDGSIPFWKLAGSDLFLLADPAGQVMGLHLTAAGASEDDAEVDLSRSLGRGEDAAWWYVGSRLYWVFIRPIEAGGENDTKELGVVAIGYEVDTSVAEQLAVVAGSKIVLGIGDKVFASTLSPVEVNEFLQRVRSKPLDPASGPRQMSLAREQYEIASVLLGDNAQAQLQCYVLVPLRRSITFVAELDRTIFALGVSAVLFASILLSFVSSTITRPLENLVAGVKALGARNFTYSITPRGSSEAVELGEAFSKMRDDLLASERQRIESERVAALGRAAGSISHDLRHYLAAVVANAEFLYESEKLNLDRDEIYGEIRTASEQMTELLDSLRELAHEHATISPVQASLEEAVRHAVEASLARPEFRNRSIAIRTSGDMSGMFDPQNLERALFNLVLNACEATTDSQAQIAVEISSTSELFEIRVKDNGTGIPPSIRTTLFAPFVSSGKSNGTGLGLAIVSKIINDHGGAVTVEHTSEVGTVFLIELPRFQRVEAERAQPAVSRPGMS